MNKKEIRDILVINPGSTTTKVAVFTDGCQKVLFEENVIHDEEKILRFADVAAQKDYRKDMILEILKSHNYDLDDLSAVVGRGGMLIGLNGGGYKVNEKMTREMASAELPQHASSLGALLAYAIAEALRIPSYIYDSTMGCNLMEIAKITGIAEIEKYGSTHLLNSRAMDISYAKSKGRDYREMNFINCHMGGGITVNAMKDGKVIDVAAYDDGPMAPERSGGVPLLLFKKLCFDGKHTEDDIDKLIAGRGGIYSYLGTKDCQQVEERIKAHDKEAALVYEAMAYQIAKSIAGLSCAFEGKVDVIILTGGVAHSKMLTDMIINYCGHIAPIEVMAGEREMEALANGAYRMLAGEEAAQEL